MPRHRPDISGRSLTAVSRHPWHLRGFHYVGWAIVRSLELVFRAYDRVFGAKKVAIGTSEADVSFHQGPPSSIDGIGSVKVWHYGASTVTFQDGKVIAFDDADGILVTA